MRETGLGIAQVADLHVAELPQGPCAGHLKQETIKWRRQDNDYSAQYAGFYADRVASGHETRGRPRMLDSLEDRARFLEIFGEEILASSGKPSQKSALTRACERYGIGRTTVFAKRNPESKNYDPIFAQEVAELEGDVVAEVRDKFFFHGLEGKDGLGDPWVQDKILTTHLPHLHGQRYEVKATVRHVHQLDAETLAAIQTQQRALMALPPADDRQVIDLEPARERADA